MRPYSLAVDAVSVYWVDNVAAGAVVKVPLAGGMTTTLASGQINPYGLAIDSMAAYWTTAVGGILSVPLAGGMPTTLASGQDSPQGIAVDKTNIYWTNFGDNTLSKLAK
jgi:DNA-binding beta-propeller fold protein YncE